MFTYNVFHRKYAVRRWTELATPRLASVNELGLPRNSVLHYLAKDEVETGIAPEEPILSRVERNVFVNHNTELLFKEGNPRSNRIIPDTEVRKYHQRYRRFRRVKKIESALRDPLTLLVENYALLGRLYRYTSSFFSRYYRWKNISSTVWARVNELASQTDRQHYIQFTLPRRLPTLSELRRAERGITKSVLDSFKSPKSLNILDIWIWLGENRQDSTLNQVAPENLDKVNLIWFETGRWFSINLGLLNGNRETTEEEREQGVEVVDGKEPFAVQKHFLRALMTLMESRTLSGLDQAEDDEEAEETPVKTPVKTTPKTAEEVEAEEAKDDDSDDSEVDRSKVQELLEEDFELELPEEQEIIEPPPEESEVQLDDDRIEEELDRLEDIKEISFDDEEIDLTALEIEKSPEEHIKESIDSLADSGLLSGAEYRRLERLATRYKELPNPFGEGTLEEFSKIEPEQLVIEDKIDIVDQDVVIDKSMLKSSLIDFDPKYITEVMEKDIASSVLNVQKAGMAVTDYKVEEVKDAINHYRSYAVKVTPVTGAPSTLRFRLPVVQEDGTYVANNVRYRMRKQRGD